MSSAPHSDPRSSLAGDLDSMVDDIDDSQPVPVAFVVGLNGQRAGKLFSLRPGESLIGRSSRAAVRIDDKSASQNHAQILLNQRGAFVVDLGSTNGTFVNGERVVQPRELHAGDVIRCGVVMLGYLTDAEDELQHTRALSRITRGSDALRGGADTAGIPGMSGSAKGGLAASVPAHMAGAYGGPGRFGMASGAGPAAPVDSAGGTLLDKLDSLLDKVALAARLLAPYWKLVAICAVAVALVGASTIFYAPPSAEATVEIFLQSEQTNTPRDHFASRSVEFFAGAEKRFTHLDLVRETMRQMGMSTRRESAVLGTARVLSFRRAGAGLFEGSYSHPDADKAELFLQKHVQNYLDREISKSIGVMAQEVDLLRQEYEKASETLKKLEGETRDFKEQNLNELPENAASQLVARAELLTRRDQLAADLERYTQELALAKEQLKSEDALLGGGVQRSQPYEQALAEVRQKIAQAKAKGFASGHPEMVEYESQERELRRLRDQTIRDSGSELDRRVNPEHKRLQNRVGQLQVSVNATSNELGLVSGRLADIERVSGAMPAVEARYAELQRELEETRGLHGRLHDQLKAKELQLEFERANAAARYEVVKEPHAWDIEPSLVAAKRGAAGGLAGLFLGLILAAAHALIRYAKTRPRPGAAQPLGQVQPLGNGEAQVLSESSSAAIAPYDPSSSTEGTSRRE